MDNGDFNLTDIRNNKFSISIVSKYNLQRQIKFKGFLKFNLSEISETKLQFVYLIIFISWTLESQANFTNTDDHLGSNSTTYQ